MEVGGPGLKLRVMHLHPANPSVAEAISTRLAGMADVERGENMINLPADDEVRTWMYLMDILLRIYELILMKNFYLNFH